MSIFDDVGSDPDTNQQDADPDDADRQAGVTGTLGGTFETQIRGSTVQIDGDEVTIAKPDTKQPDSQSGNWLTAVTPTACRVEQGQQNSGRSCRRPPCSQS